MSVQVSYKEEPAQNIRRGPWSPEEDRKLLDAIRLYGPANWVRISQSLGSRTPKQCRERYHQNLKPSLNRNPITAEEGQLIEELVAKYGKRWAEIARHLNGRSDNAIKNWWNGGANRRRRASSHAILQDVQPMAQGYPHHVQQPVQQPLQQPVKQLPQPTFNTGIFDPYQYSQRQSLPSLQQQQQQQQQQSLSQPSHAQHTQAPILPPIKRSSSISHEVYFQQPGLKRLIDEYGNNPPARRHSTQTILTTAASSPYSRTGSSRNSSISEYNGMNNLLNSSATSRRSSLAHDLFPNHMAKRQGSYSSSYLSPNLQTSHGPPMPGLMPLTPLSSLPTSNGNGATSVYQKQNDAIQQNHIQLPPPQQLISSLQTTEVKDDVFKKEFSFSSASVTLPPPTSTSASASTNGSFKNSTPPDNNEGTPNTIGEKGVMNISNLLV